MGADFLQKIRARRSLQCVCAGGPGRHWSPAM